MKKGLPYVLLTAVVFTTLEPVSKLISAQVSPFAMTFIRFLIGGLILLPFSFMEIRAKKITLRGMDYVRLVLLGVLCICISMVLLQYAVLTADNPALVAIILSSSSVFTILFAAVVLKEKITLYKALALVLCGAGVLVCADFSSQNGPVSVLLALAAALTFSLYTVLSKKYMATLSGVIQTGFSFVAGSLVLLAGILVSGESLAGVVNGGTIWNLLYLGIAVTGIGYWSYFQAMQKGSALAASLVFFIKPILTPFAALFINGIMPGVRVFVALALVLAGSYLTTKSKT